MPKKTTQHFYFHVDSKFTNMRNADITTVMGTVTEKAKSMIPHKIQTDKGFGMLITSSGRLHLCVTSWDTNTRNAQEDRIAEAAGVDVRSLHKIK